MRERERVDVLGFSKTNLFVQGIADSRSGTECRVWKGMKGGAVEAGLDKGYSGKDKEGCAMLMSKRIWKSVIGYGCKGARIVWVKSKSGLMKEAFVYVYATVNV